MEDGTGQWMEDGETQTREGWCAGSSLLQVPPAGVGRCGALGVGEAGEDGRQGSGSPCLQPPQSSPAQHGLGVATEVDGVWV